VRRFSRQRQRLLIALVHASDGVAGLPRKAEDRAALIERSLCTRDQDPASKEMEMTTRQAHEPRSLPVENYSSAIAKAVEWLGDRYLLAKPINSARADAEQTVVRMTAQRRRPSPWDV
jgi:hypothetical protein